MISRVFVERPRLAVVISLVLTVAGLLALLSIPVAQYPDITPPVVQVTATYPGADSETIATTVGGTIEEQVNGVADMLYMSSTSSSAGTYTLSVTFAVGTDPDIAQVNTQNRVAQAMARLPAIVQSLGVSTQAQSTNMLGVINVFSPDGTFDPIAISNYATINVRDPLSRVPGVGSAELLGSLDYSMRVWLDPLKLAALSLAPSDIVDAIQAQNIQASLGSLGAPPIGDGQQNQFTITGLGQLDRPEAFGEIIVRTGADGAIVRLRDVARIELGAQSYASFSSLNGKPAASVAIYQAPGANALAVMADVRTELETIAARFPSGMQ